MGSSLIFIFCNPYSIKRHRLIFRQTGWAYDGHVPSWVQVDLNSTATVSQVSLLTSKLTLIGKSLKKLTLHGQANRKG